MSRTEGRGSRVEGSASSSSTGWGGTLFSFLFEMDGSFSRSCRLLRLIGPIAHPIHTCLVYRQ